MTNNYSCLFSFSLVTLLLHACSPQTPQGPVALSLATVSNQPHLISDGNVLVEVSASIPAQQFELDLPAGATHSPLSPMADVQSG